MNVAELLTCDSMKTSRVLVQGKDFYRDITGINVLEAPDIDLWGRKGMVLLSSYFALSNLKPGELRAFFRLVSEISISALVIKVQRLIETVPPEIVDHCREQDITLIEIGRTANYQDILLDVFRPVIERTEAQLALHYRLSNISSQLSLKLADTAEILARFHDFLRLDCTLQEEPTGRTRSTAPGLAEQMTLGEPLPVRRSDYMNFTYRRFTCSYDQSTSSGDSVLIIDISCIEDRRHALIVHEIRDHQVDASDIVIIENLIRSLQALLLRDFSSRQQQQMNRNALVGDLLAGTIVHPSYREEALRAVGLETTTPTQVLTVFLSIADDDIDLQSTHTFSLLARFIRGMYPESLYYVSPNRIQVVLKGADLTSLAGGTGDLAHRIAAMFARELPYEQIGFVGGFSDVGMAENLSDLEMQSRHAARFYRQHGKWSHIGSFDSLGPLKLFVLTDNPDLLAFVPQALLALFRDQRDWYDTLRNYLQNTYSHTAAARALGVHPKTVRYRIPRIEQTLAMDVRDPAVLAVLLTAFEILTFLEGTTRVEHLLSSLAV